MAYQDFDLKKWLILIHKLWGKIEQIHLGE